MTARQLWRLLGPERAGMAAAIACRLLQSLALGLAFAIAVQVIGDSVTGRAMTRDRAIWVTGLMLLSLAGQMGFGYLAMRLAWLASFAAAARLRGQIARHLGRLPMGFHLARHRGDSVSALTSDMQTVEGFMTDGLSQIAQALGLPVVMLAFLALRDPVLALAALATILLALPLFWLSSRRLARLGILRQDRQAQAAARMIEYVQGLAVIRAFNRTTLGQARFGAALRDFRDISVTLIAQLVRPMVMVGAVLLAGVPLVLAVAAGRLGQRAAPVDLMAVLVLILSLYAPLAAMLSVMELARLAEAALTRIDRILQAEPLAQPPQPAPAQGFALNFQDVGFGYDASAPLLQGIDLTIPERSMTAIVGASGAGKSTMLNLIARFWDVDRGQITIGGIDLRDLDGKALTDLVTVVFQDAWLSSGTIGDNIALGRPDATPCQIQAAARTAQAHDFIMALPLGYDTPVGEDGATLSGGERQRISIARAILKDAPIVLLDEATAAIDPSNERALQQALLGLRQGRTLIAVAHKLTSIRHADQILVLDGGRIAERGRHETLLDAGGLYAALWRRQQNKDRVARQPEE